MTLVNSTRGVVTRSLHQVAREGPEAGLSAEYRYVVPENSELVGLLIAIYATLLALIGWIVRMVWKILRPYERQPARTTANALRR